MEVDKEILNWLTNMPEGDVNFKSNLERANEATVRAALDTVGGVVGKKVVEVALKRQLKKLLEASAEQAKGTETRQTRAVALDVNTLQAERDQQMQVSAEQQNREKMIAQCYEVIGQVKAVAMISKFGDVTNLMWMKEVKESKIYKDVPGIGTWDNFCKSAGMDRHTVDQNLLNLATFGEEFLVMVTNLKVGYKDLRKLRQLKYDGESFSMSADGKTVIIEGETIALGDDAAPEIEAALEKLLERNKTLRERNTKLEKDFKGALKEETLSYASREKALTDRVKALEPFEPKHFDETAFEEQYKEIHDLTATLASKISQLIQLEDFQENPVLMARVEGFVESTSGLVEHLREEWNEALMFENK